MPTVVPPSGPIPARIMLVGEAPGDEEVRKREPFVGVSGVELNKMLGEAGISRSECFVTNVSKTQPWNNDIGLFFAGAKDRVQSTVHFPVRGKMVTREIYEGTAALKAEILSVQPNIIIACGNTPMWALTGICNHPNDLKPPSGITDWRGSMLNEDLSGRNIQLIPTYHPAAILRQWSWRAATVHDLRRVSNFRDGKRFPVPQWRYLIRPTFDTVCGVLDELRKRLDTGERIRLSYDIETRNGHTACAGLAWTLLDAICIPFVCGGRQHYWEEHEEAYIIWLLNKVICHKNAEVVGQYITYDSQYNYRHWHCVPRITQDCMISWHSIFSDSPKDLAFQASMTCQYYKYWKNEGKNWIPGAGDEQQWTYNCMDTTYTLEVANAELAIIDQMSKSGKVPWTKLPEVHAAQQKMFWPVLEAMKTGVLIDQACRNELIAEVQEQVAMREQFLVDVLGHPLNPRSNKQMSQLFYDDLKLPVQYTRAKKGTPARPTLNDEALMKLSRIEPIVKPLINAIADIRTLGQFLSNFLCKPLDIDGRMRCSYNIGGSESGKSAPKTYRLSSSENAFGSGTNLQNIPSEKSKSLGKAAARGNIAVIGDPYQFPNIRSMFIPDPLHTWFDGDLDRADLQVVVWEAQDEMLKAALKLGVDVHLLNSFVLERKEPPPLDELVETHPRYRDHRGPMKLIREFAKVFCHGTNYGGGARTMAANTGRTIHDIDRAQKLWFGAHPGIKKWHDRVDDQIKRYRFIENRFGYRWHIFDRIDSILPEAIAWVPQSTVSIVINKIWMNIYDTLPDVQVLLQVHDSLCGQFLTNKKENLLPRIRACGQVIIPYEDPLTIPFGIKTSEISWGEVK